MVNSIYSPSGFNRISSVNTYNKVVNRASIPIVQDNYSPLRSYSAQISTTGGLSTIVAGSAGSSIVVDSYTVSATGASTFRFLSGTGNYLTGTMGLSANGSVSVSSGAGLTTVSGEALVISTSSVVGGNVTYRIV